MSFVRQLAVLVVVAAVLVGAGACSDEDGAPVGAPSETASAAASPDGTPSTTPTARPATETPSPTPSTATPEPTPTRTPDPTYVGRLPADPVRLPGGMEPLSPDTRTGIEGLDRVIEALVAYDVEAVLGLIEWGEFACSNHGQGFPRQAQCPEGAPDGTLVRSVPFSRNGEGARPSPDEVRAALEEAFAGEPQLCWITERLRWDGEPEYGVKMRTVTMSGEFYLGMDLVVRVDAQGRMPSLGIGPEPSTTIPVCH